MSFWRRRNNKVYVYTHISGKDKQVPRSVTHHLDCCTDYSIDAWIKEYDGTPDIPVIPANLFNLLEEYLTYMRDVRCQDYTTIMTHKSVLTKLVFEFFLDQGKPEPRDWPDVSIKLLPWLLARGCSNNQVIKCNAALRKFWRYHRRHKNIPIPFDIDLDFPHQEAKETPLKRLLTPDDILTFIKPNTPTDVKLMALLGYFCSLRPQETLGLTVKDFHAGADAGVKECCKTMAAIGMYNRLAVYVGKQKTHKGDRAKVKAMSKGWVACFDRRAAEMIVPLINDMGDDDALFKYTANQGFAKWKKYGIDGVTLKDLRRASLYYLGHYTPITYVMLRHHARHRDERTTWLYMRRREEGPENQPRKKLAI